MKDEVLAKMKDEVLAKMKDEILGSYRIWTKTILGGITVSINFHFLLLKYTKFKGCIRTCLYLSGSLVTRLVSRTGKGSTEE
jgi:hypothetical protein